MKERAKILSIAGFDPSGGAGILADIKTFEAHRCLGMAVCTANTIQNEDDFEAPNWIDENIVLNQLNTLLAKHSFDFVKIGLIPSLKFLKPVLHALKQKNKKVNIIWDPVLSSSSGFQFDHDLTDLKEILTDINIITPNWNEIKILSGHDDAVEGAKLLSQYCGVYLKGGHHPEQKGTDFYFEDQKELKFNPSKIAMHEKHGSGCVFSSSLAANLSKGYPFIKAVLRSKTYMHKFLSSNDQLLGYHKI